MRTLIAIALLLVSGPGVSAKTLVLEQKARGGLDGCLNEYRLSASDQAVKMEDHTTGIIIAARAPSWDVYIVNPAEKTYYKVPLETWMKRGLSVSGVDYPSYDHRSYDQARTRRGDLVVSTLKKRRSSKSDFWSLSSFSGPDKGPQLKVTAEFEIIVEPKFPKRVYDVLAPVFPHMPAGGINVSARHVGAAGAEKTFLSTKTYALLQNNFQPYALPAGYKRVENRFEAWLSKGKLDRLSEWAEELKIGEPFGSDLKEERKHPSR
ncbi:MAG TPA: hypothetical protein V6D17_17175 [Candidatus Obscuribacterales bacterium]